MKLTHRGARRQGQVRIIAGLWRGRRIQFRATPSLRPTPDSVRETLFNWLTTVVVGARCLDCYAGSGILGIEALSRGAAKVLSMEANRQAAATLNENIAKLNAENIEVICGKFPQHLPSQAAEAGFDIVFLDPPFHQNLVTTAIAALEERQVLRDEAWVYLEVEKNYQMQPPNNWVLHRQMTCGEGAMYLYQRFKAVPVNQSINQEGMLT